MGLIIRSLPLLFLVAMTCSYFPKSTEANGIGDCWETWSRCTSWSSFATGVLWQSCEDRCKCKGYVSGSCVETKSNCPFSDKAWQCQCSGTKTNAKKPSWCGF